MIHRLRAAFIGLVFVVSACGGSPDSPAATNAERVGSLGDAVEVAAGAPARATEVACGLDRSTLEAAIELYEALHGSRPTGEDVLLGEGLLRELSELHDLTADGDVVPAADSGCS